jgi:nucleoside-diphosphate-sugar epimerase
MRVFVTGATGFIGSAIVPELIRAGHKVLGLARSDAAAQSLAAAGAEAHRGDLEDLDSLRHAAAEVDGVIHCGFIHDFSNFAANCEIDRRAIEAMGAALVGTDRPLIITSGTALLSPGRLATEDDAPPAGSPVPRIASEQAAMAVAAQGVRTAVVRLPPSVHGKGDHGFVPMLIAVARAKGVSAYVGDGTNHWPAVHRLDAAVLYRLILENSGAGLRFHGNAEAGVPFREIAAAIGRGLKLPVVSKTKEEAADHFGWFAHFAGIDNRASSAKTQAMLGWQPTQVGLIADLDGAGGYFDS